jgi:hypothetical protein
LQGEEAEEVTSAARQEDDVLFYLTNTAEVAEVFNIPRDKTRPTLVLLKQEPEKVSWFGELLKAFSGATLDIALIGQHAPFASRVGPESCGRKS